MCHSAPWFRVEGRDERRSMCGDANGKDRVNRGRTYAVGQQCPVLLQGYFAERAKAAKISREKVFVLVTEGSP